MARGLDCVLTLFPFEQAFYQRHQLKAVCVGHTLADQIPLHPDSQAARAQWSWRCRLIASGCLVAG